MKRMFVASTVLVLGLAGCASGGSDGEVDVLSNGNHSNIKEQKYFDIHNDVDLKALWDNAFGKQSSPPAMPQIDWNKQMVYAAFIGPQQHGGYQVRIGKMIESADSITVDVIIITPGSGCFPPEGQTEPYTIIAMPATTKTVQPNQNQIFRPC